MGTFRTCRPLLVDATQCKEDQTIATDLGFRHVKRGDWIVRGEDAVEGEEDPRRQRGVSPTEPRSYGA